MIPLICYSSLVFGNWSLKWNEKNQRYEICYYYFFTSIFMIICFCYSIFALLRNLIKDNSGTVNLQYLIVALAYFDLGVMVLNRLINARHSVRFADELNRGCGRTVESGRHLLEFWLRTAGSAALLCMVHFKYQMFTDMSTVTIAVDTTVPLCCYMFCGSTMECQYAAACGALTQEFASVNRQVGDLSRELRAGRGPRDQWAAADRLTRLSDAHCRLTRLVRLFNDEYGAPIFFTTVGLLLCQIFTMNDIVSVVVISDAFDAAYERYTYVIDVFSWSFAWFRLWWICYRADELAAQVHLTAKIMLENDINSFPEKTRKMALDFLDQLLHRYVRITAWGFYDVNKELLFMVLGYQFGLCLICTQFTTSSVQLVNNTTTVQPNSTTAIEKQS